MAIQGKLALSVALLFILLLGWGTPAVKADDPDVRSKIFCNGDIINLQCPKQSVLSIYGVFYRVLEPGTVVCGHVNVTRSPCHPTQISRVVRTSCQGKSQCLLPSKPLGQRTQDCLKALYLTVWYHCGEAKVISGGVAPTSTERPKEDTSDTSDREGGISYFSYFFWTLFSAAMAFNYIQDRPRHVILCVILSASAGILILIVAILFMACYQKLREGKEEESDSDMDISAPIVNAAKDCERGNEAGESSPLIENDRPIQVVSVITHEEPQRKVEGSDQVDSAGCSHEAKNDVSSSHELDRVRNHPPSDAHDVDKEYRGSKEQVLSEKEAKELGHLVEIMRFYNSKLSSSQHSLPQLKDIAELQNTRNDEHETPSKGIKKSYTLPRRASKDELDELFQQLSCMSPNRQSPETFDNFASSNKTGHYENLNDPQFVTSTPIPYDNVGQMNVGTLGRREVLQDSSKLPDGQPVENRPANYAFLEKSASTLLRELNNTNDSDFLSSRSSSQTSELLNGNSDTKFSTFQPSRGGVAASDQAIGNRQFGTLDSPRRHEAPDAAWQGILSKEGSSRSVAERPEVTILSSGLLRHRSESSDYKPSVNSFGKTAFNRYNPRSDIPMSTLNSKSSTILYDTPRSTGYYQTPPANSDRVRILRRDFQ